MMQGEKKMKKIELSEHFDYKKLLKFTIPSILMMVFISVFSVIDDGLFVSNFVGKNAFVAINIMTPIATALSAIGFMFSTGGSALVAKTLGEKEDKKANEYFSMIVYFAVITGIIITILGFLVLKPFCIMLGAEGEVLKDCLIYGKIFLPFSTLFILQMIFQSFLITDENPKMAMLLTILSGIINIVFDVLLMVIFKLGIVGAVCATLSGTVLTAIIPLLHFIFSKKSKLKLVKTNIKFWVIKKSCLNGFSELISNISMALVAIVFNYKLMQIVGNDGVAAYGVIMYLAFVFSATFLGYSQGVSPIIAYNYGGKNNDELKNVFKKSIILICIFEIILMLFAEIVAVPFSKIFVSYDIDLLNMTVNGFRIYAFSLLFMGINLFSSSFFTALNDGKVSGIISFIRTFIMQIGTVLIIPIFMGLNGIWISTVVAEVLSMIVSVICLIYNKKRYKYI